MILENHMNDTTMFRRATCQMTGPAGGDPETFYFLEVREDGFINTNRLAENLEECLEVQQEAGHGPKPNMSKRGGKMMQMTFAERYLRQTSDPGTFVMIAPQK